MNCPHFTPERTLSNVCIQSVSFNSESYQHIHVILIHCHPDENAGILVTTVALTALLKVLCINP